MGALAGALLLLLAAAAGSSSPTDFDGATFYKAPLASRVRMACNASHWHSDGPDSVSLVLWFKGNLEGTPIYTVDARQRPLEGGARHLVSDAYRGRARFVSKASPPYLDLWPLEAADQSEYRCRIDYRTRPRENFLVILFVIVPPRSVQIVEPNGEERNLEHIYGPLSEGQQPSLVCLSKGGRPPPSVIWRRRQRVIDDSYLTLTDYATLRKLGQLDNSSRASSTPDGSNDNVLPLNSINPPAADWLQGAEFLYLSKRPRVASNKSLGGRMERRQLLSLQVADSVTTAVNVLRLPPIERALLADQQHQVELECQASNLHYDLRTLIKLFAPASLSERPASESRQAQDDEQLDEELQADEAQLVAAIERKLDWQLAQPAEGATAALRQQPAELEAAQAGQVQLVAAGDKRAALLLHQLQRGHQLAQSAAASSNNNNNNNNNNNDNNNSNNQSVELQQSELVRSRLIALDVLLRPSDVRILDCGQRRLSVSQLAEFSCLATGGRPAASLSWLKNGRPLEASAWRQLAGQPSDNSSRSRLSLELQRQDNGAQLTCRAQNERLPQAAALEDTCTLTVQYPPVLKLELGSKIASSQVREGADIYFVCQVDALPAIRELTWLHNGRPLNESSHGLIMSNNSLVLQRVRLEQRGHYACSAANGEGVAESNQIELRVLHAPICIGGSQARQLPDGQLLLASRPLSLQSSARFRCQMLAEPADGLQFTWYLNSTGQPSELRPLRPDEPATNKGDRKDQSSGDRRRRRDGGRAQTSSQLSYSVETSADYGRLYCLARNSVGQQRRACVYEIRPPEAHELPALSCSALNVSSASVWISCGRAEAQQAYKFQVELLRHAGPSDADAHQPDTEEEEEEAEEAGELEARLVSGELEQPAFALHNLRAATGYSALVSPLGSFTRQPGRPALVRFVTAARKPEERAAEPAGAAHPSVSLEPIQRLGGPALAARSTPTRAEPGPPGWLAALGQLLLGGPPPGMQADEPAGNQRRRPAAQPAGQQQAITGPSQRRPNLDRRGSVWAASLCLLLLASLLLLLLLRRRRRRRRRAATPAKQSPPAERARRRNSSAALTAGSETDQSRATCSTLAAAAGQPAPGEALERGSPGAGWEAACELGRHASLDSRRPTNVSKSRSSLCIEPLWLAEQQQSPGNLARLISDANSLEAADRLQLELEQQQQQPGGQINLSQPAIRQTNGADHFEAQLAAAQTSGQLPALIMAPSQCQRRHQRQQPGANYVLSTAAAAPDQVAFNGSQLLAETMLAPSSTMLRCQQPPADKLATGKPAGLLQLNKPSFVIADCHSLVSDESSDSNAHYTWSLATTATPTAASNLFEQRSANQLHYIELVTTKPDNPPSKEAATCQRRPDPSNWNGRSQFYVASSCNSNCETAYTTIKRNEQPPAASILKSSNNNNNNNNKYQSETKSQSFMEG